MINKELAHLATILCLRDDSKAILSLMKTERDPIVFYGLLDAYLIDTDYQTLSVALNRFLQEVSDLLTSLFDTSSLELKVL